MSWYKIAQEAQEEDYYAEEVAGNPNTSPEILAKILSRGNDDWVSRSASLNLNCPPSSLAEVLSRGKYNYVSQWAARNPNCPPSSLAEVLSRGKDDWVSRYAAENPKCPPLAKIKWMQLVGLIEKEDPSKHIIEEVKEEKDEDLEKLEKMIEGSGLFNWYKIAKKETKEQRNERLDREVMEELEATPRWIPVNSSWMEAVSYVESIGKLEIKVKPRNGAGTQIYSFNNVPKRVFNAFLKAPSKGVFYNNFIRGKYQTS